jgi:hypothetical protein
MTKLTVADNMILDNILDDFPEYKQSEVVAYLADIYGIEGYGTDYNDCSLCTKEDIEDLTFDDFVEQFGKDGILEEFSDIELLDYIDVDYIIDSFLNGSFPINKLLKRMSDRMYKDEFVELVESLYKEER